MNYAARSTTSGSQQTGVKGVGNSYDPMLNNNTTGVAGTGVGGKYDLAHRLFIGDEDYTPTTIAQSAQQDRRYEAGVINQAYNNPARQKQFSDYYDALHGLYTDQVNQQQQTASRQLRFANARSGNTGGSVAADNGGLLQKDYQSGLMTAADAARSGLTDLQSQDDAERRNLISLSNDASNVGQSNTGILQQAQLGIANAQRNMTTQSLGDMFGDIGNIYQNTRAQKYMQSQTSPYGASAY